MDETTLAAYQQFMEDHRLAIEEMKKGAIALDGSEVEILHCTLFSAKIVGKNVKSRRSELISYLTTAHPLTQICLPFLNQAKTAIKNMRARTLHAILDEKVAKEDEIVIVDLRQFIACAEGEPF